MNGDAACPACGGRLGAPRPVASSEPDLRGVPFALRRCAVCESAVTLGDAPPRAYDSGAYRAGRPRLHRAARPILQAFDRRRLALLRPWAPPPRRLLDVGAGRGRFVLAARDAGYTARGIEPSEHGSADAAASGAPVMPVAIDTAQIEPASVDVVTLWHVLEHLDQPGAALDRIRRWLTPGGVLLLGVPNLASLQARLGGDRWYHLDIPRHRVHFTPAGIATLLQAHGYRMLAVEHRLAEHNLFGMWQSLVNRVTTHPSYLFNVLKRNAPLASPDAAVTAAALPLIPVAAGLELAAELNRRGGSIAVVAQAGASAADTRCRATRGDR